MMKKALDCSIYFFAFELGLHLWTLGKFFVKKNVFSIRKTLPVSMMVSNMLYKLFFQQSKGTKRNEILRTVETFLATTTTTKITYKFPVANKFCYWFLMWLFNNSSSSSKKKYVAQNQEFFRFIKKKEYKENHRIKVVYTREK